MHIFTAQYYHRLWGLLLSAFSMIPAWLLIAAAHTSDQKAVDKQATRCDARQPHLLTRVCPLKWVGGKRACTLVAGTQGYSLYILFDIRTTTKWLYSSWDKVRRLEFTHPYCPWPEHSSFFSPFFPSPEQPRLLHIGAYLSCLCIDFRGVRFPFWRECH